MIDATYLGPNELTVANGSSLHDEILNRQVEWMAKELDFIILSSILVEMGGWVKITLAPMGYEKSESIDRWLVNECQGKHMFEGLVFVFEKKEDAAMFALMFV